MAANVESMFYVREKPWHGLGTMVAEAPDSAAALRLAGLDWNVIQKDIMTEDGEDIIPGFKANVRDTDGSVLGTGTGWCRMRKPFLSRMRCWARASATSPQGAYRAAGGPGYWPGSPTNTSSMARKSRRILCS